MSKSSKNAKKFFSISPPPNVVTPTQPLHSGPPCGCYLNLLNIDLNEAGKKKMKPAKPIEWRFEAIFRL